MFHIWAPCKPGSIAQSDPYQGKQTDPGKTCLHPHQHSNKTILMFINVVIYLRSKDKVASQDPTTRMLSVEPSTPSRTLVTNLTTEGSGFCFGEGNVTCWFLRFSHLCSVFLEPLAWHHHPQIQLCSGLGLGDCWGTMVSHLTEN